MPQPPKASSRLIFRLHAIQRMFERRIGVDDVRLVIQRGVTIETYAEDLPYPSRLVLGWIGSRPIHVVVADDRANNHTFVVTVYEPDGARWKDGFTRRDA